MLSEKLLNWYQEYGRQLPWRGIDNAYFIWLSEIILQQTRIEQGRSYYEHFIHEYPTVRHLADASEEQVLKSWQGLGYYSRARNLHAAARHIAYDLGGVFPSTYEDISTLKGVGRYTAAAIASFAFKLPYPVIDGNVYRFISRLYGIYTPIGTNQAYTEFETKLKILIDREHPDLFNQAIMDFGSIYCKPTGCDCQSCIFRQECVAYREGKVEMLPMKPQPVEVKERYFYYIDISWPEAGEDVRLMHKREPGDIWQGLYELPLYEAEEPITEAEIENTIGSLLKEWLGCEPLSLKPAQMLTHKLTHRTIKAQFLQAKYGFKPPRMPQKTEPFRGSEIKSLPISRLIDRYLSKL